MTTKAKTTTAKPDAMRDIYERLQVLGLKKSWVRSHLLPAWWQDDMANIPANRSQIELLLARRLGLELASLRDCSAALQFRLAPQARFKRHSSAFDAPFKKETTRALGARLGALAASASHCARLNATSISLSRWTAETIRAAILAGGAPLIGLEEILSFCWSQNVPVVNACMPQGFKKTDGMALSPRGKAVILTFSSRPHSSYHAFIAAHELGHHVLGHIGADGEILDFKIDRDDVDEEEKAANLFAVALLTGNEKMQIGLPGAWPPAPKLARMAQTFGRQHRIDAGAVLQNLCHHEAIPHNLKESTLKLVNASPTAREIYARFNSKFDLDELKDDDAEFFEKMTDISCEATISA